MLLAPCCHRSTLDSNSPAEQQIGAGQTLSGLDLTVCAAVQCVYTFVVVVVDDGDADSDSVTLNGSISMSLGKLGLVDWFLTFGCVTAS